MKNMRNALPDIFPSIGPATRLVLFTDIVEPVVLPTEADWVNELDVIVDQGLAGIACRVMRSQSIAVPEAAGAVLERAQFASQITSTRTLQCSSEGLSHLRGTGIPFVITKGAGIALLGNSMTDRAFIDVDVVVPPERFTEALIALRSLGYAERPLTMQPWDSFNRLCREAINLRNGDGGSIDLHHRVSPWYWSQDLSFEILAQGAASTTVSGVDLPLVSPVHNLLVAALHIVSDKSRPGQTFRAWRDLLILIDRCAVVDVVDAASNAGLVAWLYWIIGCLPTEVRPAELWEELSRLDTRLRGSSRLRMLMPPRIGTRHPIGQIFRLPLGAAAIFVAGSIVPSPRYLRIRYPNQNHRYVAWWRDSANSFSSEAMDSARPPEYRHHPPVLGSG